ncbi:MAG: hypothetical protein E6J34_09310 [Chloroflexi bacterium]|nr:MAG: hypothetical protein E6J34_09310 [Chloroflexota bacterium]
MEECCKMTDRVGQQIGNYRLLQLLGEGGFAEVYLGKHLYLGSQAAIKLLHTRVSTSDIAQFQQEGQMLANLIHPTIVRVLDFGIDNHNPYLIMDYAPGGTLRSRHPRGTRVPLPTVVEYAKQIGQALQYAHDQRFIHRDVKPENMLVGRNGEILLSDFGIALIAQSSRYQSTKDMAGTISYMAPEQIEAHPRPASDQYSLAIAAYEWLSGECPFRGSFTEIAVKHSVTPPAPLIPHLPSLPPAVEKVILTALAKKSEERFGSVRAFVTALELASQDAQTQPPKPSGPISIQTISSRLPSPISHAELPSLPPSPPPDTNIPAQPQTVSSLLPAQHQTQLAVAPTSSTLPTPNTHISIPMTPTPPLALPPPTSKPRRSTIAIASAITLVILLISGSVYTYSAVRTYNEHVQQTATVLAPTQTVQASINGYNNYVAQHGMMFGFNAQHTGVNPYERIVTVDNVSRLRQKWAATTGDYIYSSPTVANGVVYVGSDNHKLYAFDAITGQQKWTSSTGSAIYSSPAVANGVVYIGSEDHKLYAFDAITGQQKWTSSTGDSIDSSPAIVNGIVYVGSYDHKLYAFDAITGLLKWTASTGDYIYSSPTVANGVVYVGSKDHKLYAFDAITGQQKWTASTGDYIYSSPAIANGVVYVGSDDHKLYAFSLDGR